MKSNDEQKDRTEQEHGIKNWEMNIVIPKFMKEDDEVEEFKTPYDSKFKIRPSLVCLPAPKRKSMKRRTSTALFQLPVVV